MTEKIGFKSVAGKHTGRDFLICCPGKNILEWLPQIKELIKAKDLITIGSNKISELIPLHYHMFTNNDKYKIYGSMVKFSSILMLGQNIRKESIRKHSPKSYICLNRTDKDPKEKFSYDKKRDIIKGFYRTSGNLTIMIAHLMGANKIYIVGMSGFMYKFDGQVHYYKGEIRRDKLKKSKWKWYDNVTKKVLGNLKKHGIEFQIITPTIYTKHYAKCGF